MTTNPAAQDPAGNPTNHDTSRRHRQRSPVPSSRARPGIPSPTDRFFMGSCNKHSGPVVDNNFVENADQTEAMQLAPMVPVTPAQGQEGRRSRSPVRNPDMVEEQASVKKEPPSDTEMRSPRSTSHAPSEPSSSSDATEIPMDQNPQMHSHQHHPPYLHAPASSTGALLRQQVLFERLLRICTSAARRYWLNEVRARIPSTGVLDTTEPLIQPPPTARGATRRYHPYHIQRLRTTLSSEMGWLIRFPSPLNISASSPNLFTYILPIADRLWSQATTSTFHPGTPRPAHIEAAHRMHNLYVWAGRVVGAVETVRAGQLVRDEEVFADMRSRRLNAIMSGGGWDDLADGNNVVAAVLAARDICGWCLFEEGQKAVEEAWEEWAVGDDEEITNVWGMVL